MSSSAVSCSILRKQAFIRVIAPVCSRRTRDAATTADADAVHQAPCACLAMWWGLVNIQYAMQDGVIYVLEVNPRASRTVPFVSKSTGIPLAKVAAKLMIGRTLKELDIKGYGWAKHVSVKESVFPFSKFPSARHFLGPEMRSTGEVMGISDSFGVSFAKASMAAGSTLPQKGTVFVSLNDNDKNDRAANVVKNFVRLGFNIIATEGRPGSSKSRASGTARC